MMLDVTQYSCVTWRRAIADGSCSILEIRENMDASLYLLGSIGINIVIHLLPARASSCDFLPVTISDWWTHHLLHIRRVLRSTCCVVCHKKPKAKLHANCNIKQCKESLFPLIALQSFIVGTVTSSSSYLSICPFQITLHSDTRAMVLQCSQSLGWCISDRRLWTERF